MPPLPTDPLIPLQWYLDASADPRAKWDLRLGDLWSEYSGLGVRIGIYDSLVDVAHPDLASKMDQTLADPLPPYMSSLFNSHGTSVAGIIGAAANGLGITGIAFGATLTSVEVVSVGGVVMSDVRSEAQAYMGRFDVVNMSWGRNGHYYLGDGDAGSDASYRLAVESGRDGLGTVLIAAAGNDLGNVSTNYWSGNRYTVVVGSIYNTSAEGMKAQNTRDGSNLFIVAPSKGDFLDAGVFTTDTAGLPGSNDGSFGDPNYWAHFGGTSAAAPMVSAVVALMLEANPGLGWRDVRDILALTARHTGSDLGAQKSGYEESAWHITATNILNGSGLHFSPDYGFGLVDALAAVRLAESWVPSQTSANEARVFATSAPAEAIPETAGSRVEITVELGGGVMVETVTLFIDITHFRSADLAITLFSPSGTASVLTAGDGNDPNQSFPYERVMVPWTFSSNAYLGEDAAGIWRVVIEDRAVNDLVGTLQSLTLTAYGDAASPDTTYFYTNEYGMLAGVSPSRTIVDATGADTINAAAVTLASTIDLRPGAVSTINGQTVMIATGTAIENAVGGDGADRLTGNSGANFLQGWRGDDYLDGREGNDILWGQAGNDTYVVGNAGDVIGSETAANGTMDRVFANVSYTLAGGQAIEWLATHLQAGTGAINLTGNAFAQTLNGNDGANRLNGAGGADRMWGNGGNDDYIVDNAGDVITTETASNGALDRVFASVNYKLSAGQHIEWLATHLQAGTGAINLTGNEFAQTLNGNDDVNVLSGGGGSDLLYGHRGNDRLAGGLGNDLLSGGADSDVFVFDTALQAAANVDTIRAYSVADDLIWLEDAIFTLIGGVGILAAALFKNTADGAIDADDRVIYDSGSGSLIYDTNGSAIGGSTEFARLDAGLAMTFAEFQVV